MSRAWPQPNARAMKHLFWIFVLLLTGGMMGQPALAAEGQHPQPRIVADGYEYLLHLPKGYNADAKARWPVLVFLHGSGERGDDIERVKVHGPPKLAALDPGFPFITISPLLPADQDWDIGKLEAILRRVLKTTRHDPARIYLSGLSRGGHATWRWAATAPSRFAAIAPVSGRGDPVTACALKDLPVWAFHGDSDDVVPPEGSFTMVRAIRACGGHPRLTLYPATGHDAWTATYNDPALWFWLLSQHLAVPKENK